MYIWSSNSSVTKEKTLKLDTGVFSKRSPFDNKLKAALKAITGHTAAGTSICTYSPIIITSLCGPDIIWALNRFGNKVYLVCCGYFFMRIFYLYDV